MTDCSLFGLETLAAAGRRAVPLPHVASRRPCPNHPGQLAVKKRSLLLFNCNALYARWLRARETDPHSKQNLGETDPLTKKKKLFKPRQQQQQQQVGKKYLFSVPDDIAPK